ncbi:MAG TPA: ATP-binding protein [Methanosarcinaceae archaeon]|nr:ATP-binding protein [Methanosarcinaceae archaeon]
MINKLEEIITEFHKESIPTAFERELSTPTNIDKVITIIGLRRAGKTYYLFQVIKELLNEGLEKNRIFYINFEDERLSDMSTDDLSSIIELYYKINPDADTLYLFFDEIQEIDGWERFIRRLTERKNVRIFLTGSSSKLLSKEIATNLRGRTLSYTLFTLSFREFLNAKDFKPTFPLIESERGILKGHLDKYIKYGGFPELLEYERFIRIRTLKEYIDLMIYRDLVERFGIEKIAALKFMIKSLIRNFARELSVRKLHNFLNSSNVSLSKTKVYEYFSYLEDINFVFVLRKYGKGVREVEGSIPKIYLTDIGFVTLYGIDDHGRRIENIVAIELLRKSNYLDPLLNVYYWKESSGTEVDFVLTDGMKVKQLIQVCYDIDDAITKERELKSIVKASKELGCNDLLVITWDYEDEQEFKEKYIKFIPLWKWLLE